MHAFSVDRIASMQRRPCASLSQYIQFIQKRIYHNGLSLAKGLRSQRYEMPTKQLDGLNGDQRVTAVNAS